MLTALLLTLSLGPGGAAAPIDPRAAWEDALRLRAQGELAEALGRVTTLVADSAEPADWFARDVEEMRATLNELADGAASERDEVVRAWSLARSASDSFEGGEREDAVDQSRAALLLFETHLGAEHLDTLTERVHFAWRVGHTRARDRWRTASEEALAAVLAARGERHPLVAVAHVGLGYSWLNGGDLGRAGEHLASAAALFETLDGPTELYAAWYISCENGRAITANLAGQHATSDAHFRRAVSLSLAAHGAESHNHANLLGNMAEMLSARGEPGRALPLLRRSLAIKTSILAEGHPSLATALHNLGVLLLTTGETREAQELFEEAFAGAADDWGRNYQLVSLLDALGQARLAVGALEDAERLVGRAMALGERHFPERVDDLRRRRHTLAQIALAAGQLNEAAELLGAEDDTTSLAARAELAWRRGELARARDLSSAALASLAERASPAPTLEGALHTTLARVAAREARLDAAVQHLDDAAAAFERARARVQPGVSRASFAPHTFVSLLAAAHGEAGDARGAWEAQEAGRGRVLFELLLAAGARRLDPAVADGLRMTHDALATQEHLLESDDLDDDTRHRARTLQRALESELTRIQGELDQRRPIQEGRSYALERVAAALATDEALVGWVWTDFPGPIERLWAWALRADGTVTWTGGVESPGLDGRLGIWRDELAAAALSPFPSAPRADAARLATELFGPLVSSGALDGVTHLIAVPAAPVLAVPLEALPLDKVAVGERWAVSYAPSGTILAWLRERGAVPDASSRPALLVGDPPFREAHALAMARERTSADESARSNRRAQTRDRPHAPSELPRLPHSRDEVLGLAELFPTHETLLGARAREETLRQLPTSGYGVLHFATHALVDDARPERSALVLAQVDLPDPVQAALAGNRPVDGLLTAGEIAAGWDLDAALVTLSACETALGRAVPGEGYLGLARAFLQAGARNVLASLWSVDDRATSIFMQAFYGAWLDTEVDERPSQAEALRLARRVLRDYQDEDGGRPFDHPGTWATFVLIGDGR